MLGNTSEVEFHCGPTLRLSFVEDKVTHQASLCF